MAIAIRKQNSFGAILLVTGCCIGAEMIGLPVLSAASGFFPSSFAMFLAYLFTTGTGLLLLEAALWFEHKVNLLSIAQFALGKWGKIATGSLFLFLFYTIFVAYLDAAGQLVQLIFNALSLPISKELAMGISAFSASAVIYKGVRGVDWINRILMAGLFLSYLFLIVVGLPHVELTNLQYMNAPLAVAALPILLICFGYHNLIPSLTFHLQKNAEVLRSVIIIGNIIPFLFYLVWNFIILGMISDPASACKNSSLATDLLQATNQSGSVLYWVNAFCFFALFTSFITIALSFVDFLRDAFRKPPSELVLHAFVLIPPLLISLSYPRIFLQALSFAGGFINVILFGILPVVIIWIGRYVKKIEGPYTVSGGKPFLILMLLLCFGLLSLNLS